jgi:hypothetical protein
MKKSKVMVITKNKNREPLHISWEEEQFEQVERFEHLGTIVTADGKIYEEINHRVQKAYPNILTISKYHSRKQGTQRGYKNKDI